MPHSNISLERLSGIKQTLSAHNRHTAQIQTRTRVPDQGTATVFGISASIMLCMDLLAGPVAGCSPGSPKPAARNSL
eukprot:1158606-Pelagomonas_calceolata.AAC.10